jgi:hypothetical protein
LNTFSPTCSVSEPSTSHNQAPRDHR